MYAVFKTGGKQYRAATGDTIKVEKIEAEKGSTVEIDQVLMVGEGEDVKIGTPFLKKGKVTASINRLSIDYFKEVNVNYLICYRVKLNVFQYSFHFFSINIQAY